MSSALEIINFPEKFSLLKELFLMYSANNTISTICDFKIFFSNDIYSGVELKDNFLV